MYCSIFWKSNIVDNAYFYIFKECGKSHLGLSQTSLHYFKNLMVNMLKFTNFYREGYPIKIFSHLDLPGQIIMAFRKAFNLHDCFLCNYSRNSCCCIVLLSSFATSYLISILSISVAACRLFLASHSFSW